MNQVSQVASNTLLGWKLCFLTHFSEEPFPPEILQHVKAAGAGGSHFSLSQPSKYCNSNQREMWEMWYESDWVWASKKTANKHKLLSPREVFLSTDSSLQQASLPGNCMFQRRVWKHSFLLKYVFDKASFLQCLLSSERSSLHYEGNYLSSCLTHIFVVSFKHAISGRNNIL